MRKWYCRHGVCTDRMESYLDYIVVVGHEGIMKREKKVELPSKSMICGMGEKLLVTWLDITPLLKMSFGLFAFFFLILIRDDNKKTYVKGET